MLKRTYLFSIWLPLTLFSFANSQPQNQQPPRQERSENAQPEKGNPDARKQTPTISEIEHNSIDAAKNSEEDGNDNHIVRLVLKALDDPLTILTGALAIATFLLVWVVLCQSRDARKSSERQLRAYIWDATEEHPNLDAEPFEVRTVIKNSGVTPAYSVGCWTEIAPFDNPLPTGFIFKPAPVHIPGPRYVVNPSSEHWILTTPDAPLTEEDKMAIRAGTKGLYLWGEARYQDAFGRNRFSRFRLLWNHRGGAGLGYWIYCEEGNEAN